MESPLTMQFHGAIVGTVGYFVMTRFMQQENALALRNSVLLGNATAVYMILFGHDLPEFY